MKYIVTLNLYNKTLRSYQDTIKVFNTFSDALAFLKIIKKLKEDESVTIAAHIIE